MTYIPLFIDLGTIRAASVIESTSAYTYCNAFPNQGLYTTAKTCEQFTTLSLDVALTKASVTSVEIVVEGANEENATVWYPQGIAVWSTPTNNVEKGVFSLVASKYGTTDTVNIPVTINHKYIRVGVKGTGTLTSTSVAIKASLIRK